ncbi:MAG: radical SAM protein [Pirellulales bacterium]
MPHVALVPLVGFRFREPQMAELGMSLPGLRRRAKAVGELPALGLLTLAGATPEPWTCSYQPLPGEERLEEFFAQVMDARPTLVALSALTASAPLAYRLAQRLRAAGLPTVIGGLHATVCPDEAGRHCDAVVLGPGEYVWPQLLRDAAAGRLQPIYDARGRTAEAWPLPRFELLGPRVPRYTLQTQRGCPLACEFCGASRLLGPFCEKPLAKIRQELQAIAALDPEPVIELADDNTFAGSRDAEALLGALAEADARYFTEADWRIGERPELLRRLAASGCAQVLVGLESLVFRYPGMGAKQAELERMMAAATAIQEAGVVVNGCFILGADGETNASIDRLVEFVLASPLAEVQLTLETPFPGTRLYERLSRAGRLLPDRGWEAYTLFDATFAPDRITAAELEAGFRRAVAAVFSPAATARRAEIRRRVWRNNRRLVKEANT